MRLRRGNACLWTLVAPRGPYAYRIRLPRPHTAAAPASRVVVHAVHATHAGAVHRAGAEREPWEGFLGLGLLRVVEVASSSFAAVFTVSNCFCACSRILVTNAKRSCGVILLTVFGSTPSRGLHRGRGVLDCLGVFGPGRLLGSGDAELGLQRFDPRRIELTSGQARHASCPGPFRPPCLDPYAASCLAHAHRAHVLHHHAGPMPPGP